MGIYIKGMEMPESCWMCFARTDVNIGVGIADGCNLLKEMISNPNERLPDCPLIPVPPHGRLIDADALRQSIKESISECHKWADEVEGGEMYARVSQALGTFVECSLRVKAAPTIIPAEEAT